MAKIKEKKLKLLKQMCFAIFGVIENFTQDRINICKSQYGDFLIDFASPWGSPIQKCKFLTLFFESIICLAPKNSLIEPQNHVNKAKTQFVGSSKIQKKAHLF